MDDIAEIWDDLNDRQQAGLLEALGGKTRADVVASIISNFQTARNAMETMRNSAGSAEREMENIQNSIAFKMNALGQTWVGIAQNLYNTDGIKYTVDALTALSSILEKVTGLAGTFGTLGIAGLFGAYARTKKFMNPVREITQGLDWTGFNVNDGSSLAKYSDGLAVLNSRQANVAMSMGGLNASQRKTLTNFGLLSRSVEDMSVAAFENATKLKVDTKAMHGLDKATAKMNASMLASALHSKQGAEGFKSMGESLNTTARIIETEKGLQQGAIFGFADPGVLKKTEKGIKGFAKNTASEFKAMFSSGLGVLNAAMIFGPALIEIGTRVYDYFAHAAERALENAQDELEAYKAMKQELSSLNSEYDTNAARIRELETLRQGGQSLTLSEQGELANLKAINAELQIRIRQEKQLADVQAKETAKSFEEAWNLKKYDTVNDERKSYGYLNGRIAAETGEYRETRVSSETYIHELINKYKELNDLRKQGIEIDQDEYDSTQKSMLEMTESVRENLDILDELGAGNSEFAKNLREYYDALSSTLTPDEWFSSKLATLPTSTIAKLEELGAESSVTEQDINNLAKRFPELKQWMDQAGISTDQLVEHFNSLGNISAITGEQITSIEKALTGVESKFSLVTGALANYNAKVEAGNQDAHYQSYAEAYHSAIDEFNAGRTHSNLFWNSAELILGSKHLEELGYNAGAVKKKLEELGFAYQKVTDDDGKESFDNMGKAMYDHVKKLSESGELLDEYGNQLIQFKENGEDIQIDVDPSNLDLLAEKLGMNKSALLAFMEAWRTWAHVDYSNIEEMAKAVDEASYSLIRFNSEGGASKTVNLQAFTAELENLGYTSEDIFYKIMRLQELGYTFFDINAGADELISTLSGMGLAVADETGKISIGFDQLSTAMHLLGYDADDIATILNTLGDNVDFTDAEGKVISLDTLLEKLADSHVEPTITIETEEGRSKIQQLVDAAAELEYLNGSVDVDPSQIEEAQAKFDKLVGEVLGNSELSSTIDVHDESDVSDFVKKLLTGDISVENVDVPVTMRFEGEDGSSPELSITGMVDKIKAAAEAKQTELKLRADTEGIKQAISQAIAESDKEVPLHAYLENGPISFTIDYNPDTSEVDSKNDQIESTPLEQKVTYTETKSELHKGSNTIQKIEVPAEVKVDNPDVSSQVDKSPVDVQVHADVSSMPGEVQSAEASLPSPSVNVTANTEAATSQIQSIGATVKPITVPVKMVQEKGKAKIGADIKSVNTSVSINTSAANGALNKLKSSVNSTVGRVQTLAGKRVGNLGLGTALSAANSLLSKLNALNAKKISNKSFTVTQRNVTINETRNVTSSSGSGGVRGRYSEFAKGTKYAPGGLSLTGEEGPELVRSKDRAYIVGAIGPEIVTLKRGDQVFTARETKKIFGSGKLSRGVIPAFAEGTGGRLTIGSDGIVGKTYTVEIVARADDASLEEKLKDKIEELRKETDSILGNFEFDLFMLERGGTQPEDVVATYRKMRDAIHAQANKYRAAGLKEDSDAIQELREKWHEVGDSISESIKKAYDSVIQDYEHDIFMMGKHDADADKIVAIYKQMQDSVHRQAEDYRALGYKETSDEIQELQQKWFEYRDNMVDAIADSYGKKIKKYEHDIFMLEQYKAASSEIISVYKQMQDAVHQQAEEYRALGLKENSEEIQELQKQWFEYRDNIVEAIKDGHDKVIEDTEKKITQSEREIEKFKRKAERNLWGTQEAMDENRNGFGVGRYNFAYDNILGQYEDIVAAQKEIQKEASLAAEKLIGMGLDEQSDEVADYADKWYDAQDAIYSTTEDIIDYLNGLVSESSDVISSLTKSLSNFQNAADEYVKTGYLSVETFQEIMEYGPQYLSLLEDEDGILRINRSRIEMLTKARVADLGVQTAMSYVERLRLALQEDAVENLNELLYATEATTNATWDLVYANLAGLNLTDKQYKTAVANVTRIRALTESTIDGVGLTLDGKAEEHAENISDLIKYVMDMLSDRLSDQVDKIKEQQDEYSKLIAKKKEILKATKDENDYQKSLNKKLKSASDLQTKIDLLSLDDSRKAQAERIKLQEELRDLQEDIADQQADKMIDAQTSALDKIEETYKEEKENEIKALQESVSSYQKKWDQAVAYIKENYGGLHAELIQWNYEIGSTLTSEIENAWKNAEEAVRHYGSVVEAVLAAQKKEEKEKEAVNDIVGKSVEAPDIPQRIEPKVTAANAPQVKDESVPQVSQQVSTGIGLIEEMVQNANAWHQPNADKNALSARNLEIGNSLAEYGINAWRDQHSGVWYLGDTGQRLFDLYERYKNGWDIGWITVGYPTGIINKNVRLHSGAVVGGGTLKENEKLHILEDKEWVLSKSMVKNLSEQMDRIRDLGAGIGFIPKAYGTTTLPGIGGSEVASISSVTNNRPVTINIGDTIIHGENGNAVSQHIQVNEQMVNKIVRMLGVRR